MKVYLSLLQVVSVQAVELLCLPGFIHGLVEGISQIHELGAVLGQPVLDAAQQVLVGLPAGVQLALHSMQHCTGGQLLLIPLPLLNTFCAWLPQSLALVLADIKARSDHLPPLPLSSSA